MCSHSHRLSLVTAKSFMERNPRCCCRLCVEESASATESLFNQWKGGMAFRMESRASIRFAGGGDSDRAERNSSGEAKRLRFRTKDARIRINLSWPQIRAKAWPNYEGFSSKNIRRSRVRRMG